MATKPIYSLPVSGGIATKQDHDTETNRVISRVWEAAVVSQLGDAEAADLVAEFQGYAEAVETAREQIAGATFRNLAALLASEEAIAVGQIVQTRAEGFSFAVVSSGAHLTTAGGVKLQWRQARKIFVLATGQSNMQQHRSYSFTPAPNVLRWNNTQNDMSSVGTAFVPLTGETMNPSISFANQVATENPDAVVFLVNVARGGAAD